MANIIKFLDGNNQQVFPVTLTSAIYDEDLNSFDTIVSGLENMVGSPLVAATAAAMTDTDHIYVYTGSEAGYTSGHWYYYDGDSWEDGGVYNSTAFTTDTTLAVSGMAADAKVTGDKLDELKTDIDDVSDKLDDVADATVEYTVSTNLHNPQDDVPGVLLYTGKSINSSGSGITSGFIPVSPGDVVYYTGIEANDTYAGISSTNCRWLAFYTSQDMNNVVSCSAYQNSATVPATANYIRATFSQTTRKLHCITINSYPKSVSEMEKYYAPYYRNIAKPIVNTNIIDCWGDSRTAMINDGTSYTDYLNTLLGDRYNVCNYGITAQSSGNIAMRLGANEVFVSLTGNTIPASGSVTLTGIKSFPADQISVYSFSADATSPCIIGGVRGRLNRSNSTTITENTFIRDGDGSAVVIRPYTKVCVDNVGSQRHICLFWWGKNDYSKYIAASPNPQILANYKAAVEYINHDYFVILGETCSIGDDWKTGGNKRTFLDELNAELASLYPNNYIDINAWLSSTDALTSVGLTATATDLEYISYGFPCYQLMNYSTSTSDPVHPNAKGRQAIANKIYAWMQSKGWA